MAKEQTQIWEEHIRDIQLDSLRESVEHPAIFQLELKEIIDSYVHVNKKTIIEVGCETGVSSLILSNEFDKTLLDLNPQAIELAKKLFYSYGMAGNFIVADMFDMPFEDGSFDIVFNAGVVEHFKKSELRRAFREYSRILASDGVMIIGFPNQFSIPYKTAQWVRMLWGRWIFPYEYAYYDLKDVLASAGLKLECRKILSKQSIYGWWNFCPSVKMLFEKTDCFFNWGGYLILLIIRKM